MAKLPNFVEKDRSLWTVSKFVFLETLRGSKKASSLRYITTAVATSFSFAQFGALALLIDEFSIHGIHGARVPVLVGSFAVIIASTFLPPIIGSVNEYYFNIQQDDMARHNESRHFKKMHELDIGTIEQPEFQNMMQTINNRSWSSFYALINLANGSIKNAVAVTIASISLLVISPIVLLIIFIACIPTYFLERASAEISAKKWKDNAERNRMWSAKVSPLENKDPLIELKNFNTVLVFKDKFLSMISEFHHGFIKVYRKQLLNDVWTQIALAIGFIVAFALLVHDVATGVILLGSLVYAFSVIGRFQSGLNQLFDGFGRASEHRRNVNLIMDFYEMKPLIVSGKRTIDQAHPISVEFKNVSFAYPSTDKLVIKNLSLTITQGENIAIVGLNGAGKTTLIKLLTRVYDPTEGEILVNGINLQEYDLTSWKQCLGILLQEYSIYSEETVAENILLGDVSKTDRVIMQQSAEETTIAEVIAGLPMNYQQKVGTEYRGGVEFSKGQKQKLALARVIYRQAPFIILDEPTASIDAVSEDTIFKNLRVNHRNQTRLVISHKFSNVRDSDQIILIKHGTVYEHGTHDELMKQKGEYKKLFEMQAQGYR